MRAFSLWQPWASLWLSPAKPHETRRWSTAYRGPLAVHAAKTMVKELPAALEKIVVRELGRRWRLELPRGALIGTIQLGNVASVAVVGPDSEDDRECGDWSAGHFAWRRHRPQLFDLPVPWKGHQRFFDVPDEVITAARNGKAA